MAPRIWMVFLGFLSMLCAGVRACTLPVQGVFVDPESAEMKVTITETTIHVVNEHQKGHGGVISECLDQQGDIYLFQVKQDEIEEKWFACSRIQVDDDGNIQAANLKHTGVGERGWADADWHSACSSVTQPLHTLPLTRVNKEIL